MFIAGYCGFCNFSTVTSFALRPFIKYRAMYLYVSIYLVPLTDLNRTWDVESGNPFGTRFTIPLIF